MLKTIPVEIISAADPSQAMIRWGEAEMVQDPIGGRTRPVLQEDCMHEETYDCIISAIGQGSNLDFLPRELPEQLTIERLKFTPGEYQRTPLQGLFVGQVKEGTKHKLFFRSEYDERVLMGN